MRVSSRTITGLAAVLLAAACTSKSAQEKPLAAVAPQPVSRPPAAPRAASLDWRFRPGPGGGQAAGEAGG